MNTDISPLAASFIAFLPETALVLVFAIAVLLCLLRPGGFARTLAVLVLLGFAGAAALMFTTQLPLLTDGAAVGGEGAGTFHAEWIFKGSEQPYGFGMLVVDGVGLFFKAMIALAALVAIPVALLSRELQSRAAGRVGYYFALLPLLGFASFVMCGANDLIVMYAAVEVASLASYALVALTRDVPRTIEASVKYLVFGGLATAVMLFGISLMYGLMGTTNFAELGIMLGAPNTENALRNPLILSSVLIAVGLAYKVAAAPFHFWAPDVYEGAPLPVVSFLAVAQKAAGVALMVRFITVVYPGLMQGLDWTPIIGGLAVLTMSLGNLAAMQQTSMKRMLGYLSVAHGGYMLLGLAVGTPAGITSILITFATYLGTMLTAFFAVQQMGEEAGSEEIEDMRGFGRRAPLPGAALVIAMISLAGLPPTAGFVGRLFLFTSLVDAGASYLWLAAIAAANGVVALYAAARVVKALYLRDGNAALPRVHVRPAALVLLCVLGGCTLLLCVPGVFGPLVQAADEAVRGLAPYLREPGS